MVARWAVLLPMMLLAAQKACIPEHVVWNGGELVYTHTEEGRTSLRRLDSEGRRQMLVEKLDFQAATPAVSPDGKRIALVEAEALGPRARLRVHIFDSEGKPLGESPPWEWTFAEEPGDGAASRTAAWWSPDGERLLVLCSNEFASYTFASREFKAYANVKLSLFGALMFSSPIMPDGQTFLAQPREAVGEAADADSQVVLVDWQGKLRLIEEAEEEAGGDDGSGASDILPVGAGHVMGEYRFIQPKGYSVFNYSTGAISVLPDAFAAKLFAAAAGAKAKVFAPTPSGEAIVCARPNGMSDSRFAIVRVAPGEEEEILVADAAPVLLTVEFVPAPDGRRLAVQYRVPATESRRLLMLDSVGKKLFDVEL